MNIKKNFIVALIFIVLQLSIVRAKTEEKSKETNSNHVLNQEIDTLTSHINDFTENVIKYAQLIVPNSNIHYRKRRSLEQSGFNSPSLQNQLHSLVIKVKNIKEDVETMKNASDSSETKERFGSLEATTERLQKIFDETSRKIMAQMKRQLHTFVHHSTTAVENVEKKIEELKVRFDENEIIEKSKLLRTEIVEDIRGRDYDSATKKLHDLSDNLQKNINLIVHEVYNNHEGNFNTILNFGDSRGMDLTTSVAVYRALNFEMESNGHNDYVKILKLIKILNNKFDSNDDGFVQSGAEDLKNKLLDVVEKRIEFMLMKVVITNDYVAFSEIFENIRMTYLEIFKILINKALNDKLHPLDVEKLVTFFVTQKYSASLNIWVYSAVFSKLQSTNNLDQTVVITLALGLKEALDDSTVDEKSREEGEKLKKALPESAKNLAFAERVCLRNIHRNEYLYASFDDDINYDSDRRTLYTLMPSNPDKQSIWVVERNGHAYHIKNEHLKEYMYESSLTIFPNSDLVPKKSRYVFTRIPKDNRIHNQNWKFEPSGSNVYIKNNDTNKYLFASNNKNQRFIYNSMKKDNSEDSLWAIEDCLTM